MCGRYIINPEKESDELDGIIAQINRRAVEPLKTSGEVFPADIVPVVASNRRMSPAAFAMQWGYALPGGRRVINARSETAREKPMFRNGMLERRCAVPATRYFEWERAAGRRAKYAIWPEDGGLFYMAGIYRLEAGRPVFCILTRDPAPNIAFIHDRMPVILPRDSVNDWIDPRHDAGDLLTHAVRSVACERAAQ